MSSTTTTTGGWYVDHMCPRCRGNHHLQECPQVKRIEFDEAGRVKWVEFFLPSDYLPPMQSEGLRPPYDITVTSSFTAPYDPNKARAWYETAKTYTY